MIVKLKSIVAFMLSVAMVLGTVGIVIPQGVKAEEVEEFVIEDGVLTKYNGTDTEVTIPKGVKRIANYVFSNKKDISKVTIPEGVVSIGDAVFSGCSSLETIEIPSTVSYFGERAFGYGSDLINDLDEVIVSKTKWLENMQKESALVIINNILVDATSTTGKVEIPEGVVEIAPFAFTNSTATEIVLPDTVTELGYGAFNYATKAESINIPNGVKNIKGYTFFCCESLKKLYIPDSVTYLGLESFTRCDSLTELWLPASITAMNNPFFEWNDNVTVYCEENSYIYNYITKTLPETYPTTAEELEYQLIEAESKEVAEVVALKDGETVISAQEMENLVDLNQTRDVVIESHTGVKFTFLMGNMKLIEGKDSYDFDITLVNDYTKANPVIDASYENVGDAAMFRKYVNVDSNNFVVQLQYNNLERLPGLAKVSIPVTSEVTGDELLHYEINNDGALIWLQPTSLDNEGYYNIIMEECMDYTIKNNNAPADKDEGSDNGNNTGSNSGNNTNNSNQNVQNTDKPQVTNPPSNSAISGDTGKASKPKKAKIKSLKSVKGKKLKVTWKKDTQANGYQLQVATNKKFTKNKKSFYVNKSKVTNKTVKKLKKGKKYYVRVRAFKKVNGNKVYGKWSAVKKSKKIR